MTPAVQVSLCKDQIDECIAFDLTISDYDLLVKLIVEVTLGKATHVSKILNLNRATTESIRESAHRSALEFFTPTKNNETFHRDGWMFQVISWISTLSEPGKVFSRVPHMRKHQSGIDGFSLILNDELNQIDHAMIYEEKATNNPRKHFYSSVIPELIKFESGIEESIITSEILAFEDKLSHIDIEAAAGDLLVNRKIRYRISLTSENKFHNSKDGKKGLFNGYKDAVAGDDQRRIGVLMYNNDVRLWFDKLAQDCKQYLDQLIVDQHV